MSNKKLEFSRVVDATPEEMYRYWTDPQLITTWFCPKPWNCTKCENEVKPGGAFNTTIEGPEGQSMSNKGCFLEVVPNRKLVFTDALAAGYVPNGKPFMVATVEFEKEGNGTRYSATLQHWTEEDCKKHAEMGFPDGWLAALDQMLEQIRGNQTKIPR